MLSLLRHLSWPELRHHPWRNLAALLAVMLGVALAFSVQLINQSALGEFSSAVRAVNGEPDFELRGQRGGFDEALYGRVATQAQVAIASPIVELDTYAFDAQGQRVPVHVVGIDALVAARLSPALMPRPDAGLDTDADRFAVLAADSIFLNAQAQQQLGNPRSVRLQTSDGSVELQVRGSIAAIRRASAATEGDSMPLNKCSTSRQLFSIAATMAG
jgi:putative ABC transport system permease protein